MPEVKIVMQLKIMEIYNKKGETISYNENVSLSALIKEVPELVELQPVNVQASANYFASLYHVRAEISTEATLKCTRCLDEYSFPIQTSFNESFVERKNVHHVEGVEDDSGINIVEGEWIAFTSFVSENVLLAFPFVALCSEDCQGLCYECGINLNKSSCNCQRERIDPRLADLANFFKK